jgi:hypothetical protein
MSKTIWTPIFCILICSVSLGEETATANAILSTPVVQEAKDLEDAYGRAVANIREPVAKLTDQYIQRLESLRASFQTSGNLEGVLATTSEIDALNSTGRPMDTPISNETKEVSDSRAIYLRSLESMSPKVDREVSRVQQLFIEKLGYLQATLTKSGRVEDALLVRDMISANQKIFLNLVGLNSIDSSKRSLKCKVQVDGVSYLLLQGQHIWFDHTKGLNTPPGLHEGSFPTYFDDKIEWFPVWNGRITDRFQLALILPDSEPAPEIGIRHLDGRGYAEIVEQPSKSNDYTAKIQINDLTKDGGILWGSEWIEFELKW